MVKFSKTLFGFKPKEVIQQIDDMEKERQQKIEAFNLEIIKIRTELKEAEEKRGELQKALNDYMERERLISDVMVTAQSNALRIEEQARERARLLLENAEEELKAKMQELDFLRIKVARFKEEFRDVLDDYRVSLEKIREEPEEDPGFTPTLITKENKRNDVSY